MVPKLRKEVSLYFFSHFCPYGRNLADTTQCSLSAESAEEVEVAGPSVPVEAVAGLMEVPSNPMVDRFPDLEALEEEEEWHTPAEDTSERRTSEPDLLVYR